MSAKRGLATVALIVAGLFAIVLIHAAELVDREDAALPERSADGPCRASPRLSGTFLQPYLADSWSVDDWVAEFRLLREVCITDVVLQWTADSRARTTVYPSGLNGFVQSSQHDLVGNALAAADSVGLDIYLGLQVNDDWWVTGASDPGWLSNEAATARALIDDLAGRYRTHQSFAGWYLPFEVDNHNFTSAASWDAMTSFYRDVSSHAHTRAPGLPVVIAPFFNPAGGLTPAQWTEMWTTILANSDIDVIALQDGVGVGHAAPDQLATWFAATRNAIDRAAVDTKLWADTETFNADFQPLGIQDVVASMKAVEGYVTRFWSFSYNHYQSARQVDSAYHRSYLGYLTSGSTRTHNS